MNVGIDITSVIYGRGVSRYTANLVRALYQRKEVNLSLYGSSWNQLTVLQEFEKELRRSNPLRQKTLRSSFQKVPPKLQKFLWNTLGKNPVSASLPHLDIFHSWDWIQPPDKTLPLVSTIHDLAIVKYPETAHAEVLKMHRKSWEVLQKRNAEIVAVSHSTKKDIVSLLGFPAHKVHVVYEALPLETQHVADSLDEDAYDTLKQKLQLTRPFILFVGTREPRKNLLRLIEAWQPLAKDLDLVIAGEKGWDQTDDIAKKLQSKNLRFLGRVSDQELAVLYGEAELFAYPSIDEGFGLPILEAFYHGAPVLTSNISSMVEVAGNAAELVDPFSVESIHRGLKNLLQEKQEEQQKRLQRMIIRLHLFSWEKVAEDTVKVYQKAYESRQ